MKLCAFLLLLLSVQGYADVPRSQMTPDEPVTNIRKRRATGLTPVKQTKPVLNLQTLTQAERNALKPSLDFDPIGKQPQDKNAGRVSVQVSNQIINGELAVKNQFPWQVAIIQDRAYFCGGSVVTKLSVLTAAHCCYRRSSFNLYMGVTNYKDKVNRVAFTSTTKYIHKDFTPTNLNYDICVIRLPRPGIADADLASGKIRPVRLPSLSDAYYTFEEEEVTIAGWGKTGDDASISDNLNFAKLITITNEECAQIYGTNVVLSSVICTSGDTEQGICSGDSGGPLVIREEDGKYTQIGIVSFGASKSCSNHPSGYTRVASLLGWISKTCSVAIRVF